MTILSENLNRLLTERRMTQKQLAEAAGVPEMSVSNHCLGKSTARTPVLQRYAEALGTTAYDLLQEHEPEEDEIIPDGRGLPITEAAKAMGKSQQFIRVALQRQLVPFGIAIQNPGGRWSYYINPTRFQRYIAGR